MKQNGAFDSKVWVDADFARTCGQKPSGSAKAVKLRHRCVITFGGAPLVWKSQLISEICFSTTHAECIGLSNSVQALIPIWSLIKDALKQLKLTLKEKPKIPCEAFKVNGSVSSGNKPATLAKNQALCCEVSFLPAVCLPC